MKKDVVGLLFLVFFIFQIRTSAQMNYNFAQAAGTYTPLATGTVFVTGSFDEEISAAITIPAFQFNCSTYTSLYISANGFITFGTAPAGTNYIPLSSTATYSGAISAFGSNLKNASSGSREIKYSNVAASNEFVIQWQELRRSSTSGERISFQIRLNYSTNVIKMVYGGTIVPASPGGGTLQPQVGLRRNSNAFYVNRILDAANNWLNSIAGSTNAATCNFAPGITLSAGLTYTWTPAPLVLVPNCSSNPSPLNLSIDVTPCAVSLFWDAPPVAICNQTDSYDVYFGTSASPPFYSNSTSTSVSFVNLLENTIYYWKVIPKNVVGDATGCSTWQFQTSTKGPGCASAPIPSNGATGVSVCSPWLSWTGPTYAGCAGVGSSSIYCGTTNPPPYVGSTNLGPWFQLPTLLNNTTYYWKVVEVNAIDSTVTCPVFVFQTGNCTPVCTSIISPLNMSTNVSLCGQSLSWNSSVMNGCSSSTSYDVYFGTSVSPPFYLNTTATSITLPALTDNTIYYWKIIPKNAVGTASGCTIWQFQTGNSIPTCASLIAPLNMATNVSPCGPLISWSSSAIANNCGPAINYDVYFGTTSNPPFYLNTFSTSLALPVMADNTTYFWKIVSNYSTGTASGCVEWQFQTGTSASPYYCYVGDAGNYGAAGPNCVELTGPWSSQRGCAWNRNKISFASPFDYTVNMYLGSIQSAADGSTFTFQNSPQGFNACGNAGGQLGAGGISNAVVIEFDTYDNDNPAHVYDMAADHTAIEIDGNLQGPGPPLCGPVQADPLDAWLDDGQFYLFRVTWDPSTKNMKVFINGSQRLSCTYDFVANVFGGDPNVYWGVTGATGFMGNHQFFCPLNIPLPIELLDFSAECNDGKVKLNWSTGTETNNDYFTIERTINGIDFETRAIVDGRGTSSQETKYEWIDEKALEGNSYYRLRQTDYDGENHYFDVVSVICESDNDFLNVAQINTIDKTLNFNIESSFSGIHAIKITDIFGKTVFSNDVFLVSAAQTIDISNLKGGLYILTVSNEYKTVSKKIIVSNLE